MIFAAAPPPGCEIPRKPFRHWLPGGFPCAQILGLSVMVWLFLALFFLVFHRWNIKNAPRFLAEGGLGWWKIGRECSKLAKMEIDRKTACCGLFALPAFSRLSSKRKCITQTVINLTDHPGISIRKEWEDDRKSIAVFGFFRHFKMRDIQLRYRTTSRIFVQIYDRVFVSFS